MAKPPEERREGQYARPEGGAAINPSLYSRRQIGFWGGFLLLTLLPLFIHLGVWQWDKGQAKLNRQAELDAASHSLPAAMPAFLTTVDALRHRHFVLRGEYDPSHQVLVDNRVYQDAAGYHVITPLRLAGTDLHVLVNRGWLPAAPDHSEVPAAAPPAGPVTITGIAVVPPERFFTLASPPASGWEPVWQNLDLERFRKGVSYALQPVVLQLDADAPGGYGRDWPRPDSGAERHLSYAMQWFGFAATSIGIWLYFLLRRS